MSANKVVVLDTNVLVAALLSPFGPPGRILDLVTSRRQVIAFDDRILLEYREVLVRSKFGVSPARVDELLSFFGVRGLAISAPPLSARLPDMDDLPFLEVAHAINAPLVTGNLRHFPPELRFGVAVFSPQAFLAQRTDV